MQLRKEAFSRYQKALESADDDDPEATAKAMFEVAVDAVSQTLAKYHTDAVQGQLSNAEIGLAKSDLASRMDRFEVTTEGKVMLADTALKGRMQKAFEDKKAQYGWRLAMTIPYLDYYRMAGGKKGKAAKASKGGEAARNKDEALAASRSPRGRRTTAAAGRKPGKKSTEQLSAEYIQATGVPFFNVS